MRPSLVLLLLFFFGCASALVAGDVVAVDAERRTAQVAAKPEALDRVLHDALVYRHSDGREESKTELMASLIGGAVDYREIRVDEIERMACDGPERHCVRARQVLEVTFEGREFTVSGCYVAAYERSHGMLKLIRYHSAALDVSGGCPL